MLLSGTGITTPRTLKVIKYQPVTKYALSWTKTASGNYVCADRGSAYDVYESKITIAGYEYYVDEILDAIQLNRAANNHILSLTAFNGTDDMIFGADVDYSSGLSVTVSKLDERKQKSWHGYSFSMTMRVLSPSFTGSSSMPTLQYISKGYTADTSFTVDKKDVYDATFVYLDEEKDAGELEFEVLLSTANMRSLRRYVATERGNTITINSIAGMAYPFGSRGSNFPIDCKIIDFEDKGMRGKAYYYAKLKLAEQVVET